METRRFAFVPQYGARTIPLLYRYEYGWTIETLLSYLFYWNF
jgi:hypothetical protein